MLLDLYKYLCHDVWFLGLLRVSSLRYFIALVVVLGLPSRRIACMLSPCYFYANACLGILLIIANEYI